MKARLISMIKNKEQEALEFAKQRQEWKKDPIKFFNEVLGIKLPIHQRRMLLDCLKHNRVAICTGNSTGKCGKSTDFSVLGDGTLVKNKDLISKEFKILSYDNENQKQYSENARAIDNGLKECIEIKTQSGKVIRRTINHQLYKGTMLKKRNTVDGVR